MTEPETRRGICGICGKPFKDSEVVVQAARYPSPISYRRPMFGAALRLEILRAEREENKFWAHPACVFTIARETEGPAERQRSK
jgi:hypothetical protein